MNDWIVANINNPDFSASDFRNIADMTLDNTQMLKRDQYMKSEFIKQNPLFKDDKGEFSEDKFNQFYDTKLAEFQEFQNNIFPETLELDMFDTDITADSKIRDDKFYIGRGVNPDRQKVGIEGINKRSNPEYSKSEIAQMNKIWDSKKGEYKDYSPNDKALTNDVFGFLESLVSDPLVLATWDEDGEHMDPITGQVKKHVKGEHKLNDKGTYYYETLNGRSPIGKQVLSMMDNLTVDGQGINKYDFFDSDDIEKSVAGVITKNVVSLLPLFAGAIGLPGIATAYSSALIAREMSKALPMLYNLSEILFDTPETPKWINRLAAQGEKFTGGTSDYAKQNTFSVENFGNLISDVALQWGQQKTIASAFNKLRGTQNYVDDAMKEAKALYDAKKGTMGAQAALKDENWKASALGQACIKKFLPQAEKAAKQSGQLGRDASLAYMSVVSNSDVFNEMLEHGATRGEAAAVALGSTLGMFAVDKYTGIGELFFDDATEQSVKNARRAIKKEIFGYTDDNGVKHLGALEAFDRVKRSNQPQTKKLLNYIQIAADKGKKVMSEFSEDLQYHSTAFLGKAVGEGLEEVSEELIADTAKAIYELSGKFGIFDTAVQDVGAWDNALERYSMSLFGGMLGGGIFYGKEVLDGNSFKRDKSNEELATLIRNGHADDVRSVLNKLRKKGKIGSTTLSAYDYETVKNKEGNEEQIWLTTKDKSRSQNEVIANMISEKINAIEAVINNNQVGLSDEDLFKQMVLSESRYYKYQDIAPITNYYQDFNTVLNNLIQAELNLSAAAKTKEGTVDGTVLTDNALSSLTNEEQQQRSEKIALLQEEVKKARDAKNEFLSGNTSLDYTRKLNFAIDPRLHSQFLAVDAEQLWKQHFGEKQDDEISEEEKTKFLFEILPQAKQQALKENLTVAWNRYKQVEKLIIPELGQLALNTPQFKQWSDQFQKVLESGVLSTESLMKSHLKYDDKLETETDEQYEARDTKLIDPITGLAESDEDFNNRRIQRRLAIEQYNDQKDQEWATAVMEQLNAVGGMVDPISARILKNSLPKRAKDVILRKIAKSDIPLQLKDVLKRLNGDLSNTDELLETIQKVNAAYVQGKVNDRRQQVEKHINDFSKIKSLNGLLEYLEQEDPEHTINAQDIIDDPEIIVLNDDEDTIEMIRAAEELQKVAVEQNIPELMQIPITELFQGFIDSNWFAADQEKYNQEIEYYNNNIQSILNDVNNNAIVQLNNSIKDSIKNPILELVTSLAGKVLDKEVVPKIEETLAKIEDDYQSIESVESLVLDDAEMQVLQNTKDALKLIETFLYAASSTAEMNSPIGHNKVINEYAKNHRDLLLTEWEELPEIDSDYAAMYLQQLHKYSKEIDGWIQLSNDNAINKKKQFEKVDSVFTKSLHDLIQNKANAKAFKVNIDDKEYNLLETLEETGDDALTVFNAEKTLYKNFQEALYDSKLSVAEFLEKSQLLEKLVPNFNISNQKIAKFEPSMTHEKFTDYDKVKHFAMLFTLNPIDFQTQLKGKIAENPKIAPITVQEYDSKLATASTNQQFRDIIEYAFKKSGDARYMASNTTVVMGSAGAGKSQVVAKFTKDFQDPDTEIWVAGPTKTQAKNLQTILKTKDYYTISNIFKKIIGDDYLEIKKDIDTISWDDNNQKLSRESKFFTVHETPDGFIQYSLKKDAPIKFKDVENIPKLLIIDEATHLSSIEAQILNEYMKKVGGQQILIGDSKQRGYFNYNNGMGNIRDVDMFAIRTPELTISLRDNNIQKQSNLEIVRSLLDQVQENVINLPEAELNAYWESVHKILPKMNFKVYNKEELNGDFITNEISPEVISKIKKEGKTVGFIGNTTSATYQALKNAGLINDESVLSLEEMQGQEFDYVVIDHNFKQPDKDISTRNFLQDLYTLMSRGREASIFIDNGLSDIIGKNIYQEYKAKAPSLNDVINGTSAVEELRNKKLKTLSQYDLTPIEIKGKPVEVKKQKANPAMDFKDPGEQNIDPQIKEFIEKVEKEDVNEKDIKEYIDTTVSQFTIPSWGDVTYTGVTATEGHTETSDRNGKEYTNVLWEIKKPEKGPLRNLQALLPEGSKAFWYTDKEKFQDVLFKTKAALLFDHGFSETRTGSTQKILPPEITNNFNESDWNNGTYELEIRDASGEIRPLHSQFKENGMSYKGKNYSVNIVFKVKNKKGEDCVFDLSGINNPETLNSNLETIKNNIQEYLDKKPGLSSEVRGKLQNILKTIDQQAKKYENLFDSWIKKYEESGEDSFSVDVTHAINKNKTTWFKKRTGPKIRLGGDLNPNTLEKDGLSLKVMNPGMVFSKVYTYGSKDTDFDEIDPSVRGKAVVFYSSDSLLRPEDLAQMYFDQKKNPDDNTPVVRMLVLDNYGMSMSQLMDKDFINEFQSGDEENRPIRQNYVGIQMFTSMWNFRASLNQFLNALGEWQAEHKYSSEDVQKIIEAQNYIYENKLDKDAAKTYLESIDLKEQDLENLQNFNQEKCKDIPTFRLGYSKKNGFHVQQFDISDSKAYENGKVNLLVIDPEKAQQFKTLLDDVLRTIVSDDRESLGLKFQREEVKKDEKGNPIKDDKGNEIKEMVDWGEDELIDLKQSKHTRSLSGLMSFKGGITVSFNGQKLLYPEGQHWSYIPSLISSIIRTTTFYQYNPEAIHDGNLSYARISVYDGIDSTGKKQFTTIKNQVGVWLDRVDNNGLLKVKQDDTEGHPDRSLMDMFDLIFHGTVDDIHKYEPSVSKNEEGKIVEKSPEKDPKTLMQLSDARFPKGFFIHPTAVQKDPDVDTPHFENSETGNVIFYAIDTSDEFFLSDVDLRSSGISLDINALLEEDNDIKNQPTPDTKFKVGDEINILTSDGEDQGKDGRYKVIGITNTKYGARYNLEGLYDKKRVTLDAKDVDSRPDKYIFNRDEKDLIKTDKYEELELSFTGVTTGDIYKGPLLDIGAGRTAVMVNINGMHVPFYCSTGMGGKKSVQAGKWYPFFGLHEDGWINKLSEADINNYYGISLLKEIAEQLDAKYGDVTGKGHNEAGIVPTSFTVEYANKGMQAIWDIVNRDFIPVDNGTPETKDKVKANVEKLRKHISDSFGETFDSKYPVAYDKITNELAFHKLDLNERGINKAIEILNKTNIVAGIDALLSSSEPEETLKQNFFFRRALNGDIEATTLNSYFQSLLSETETLESVDVKEGKIIIKTNKETYSYNKDSASLEKNVKENDEETPVLKRIVEFNGEKLTVTSHLKKLKKDEDFINAINEETGEENGDKLLESFIRQLDNLSKLEDQNAIIQALDQLNNLDDPIISVLSLDAEELYNELFINCK